MNKYYIYAVITIFFWGSSAAVGKLLLESIDTVSTLLYSCSIAFLFLLVVNIVRGKIKELKKIKIIEYVKLIVCGLLGVFVYDITLYYGMTLMKAQQAFIINYLWPIMIVIFSCILLGEKMTFKKAVSMLLSFFGVMIVASEGNFGALGNINIIGLIACIIAAVSYGLFSVLTIKIKEDKLIAMMVYYGVSALLSLIVVLVFEIDVPILTGGQWPAMIWNGVLVFGVAYTLWTMAIDGPHTTTISNLAYLTPFISLIWINILIGEPIEFSSIIGLVFIIGGVILQMIKGRN